jgi:beta-glucanase (GH16 family)
MKAKSNKVLLAIFLTIGLGLPSTECTAQKNLKWKQLFNGKDLNDWQIKIRYHELDDNFGNTFQVNDGNIQVRYDEYDAFGEQFGHLFYKQPFSSYLIGVEYRFVGDQVKEGPGWAYRNSGIMIHGQDPATMTVDQDFPNSIEVQLLGGNGKDERSTANLCTPGTQYVKDGKIIKQHCTNSTSKTFHGDQWVRTEVLVLRDSLIVHYVNGEEVMRYTKPQLDPDKGSEQGKLLKSGSISLQSESHPVDFRKVEIIDLEKYADKPKKLKKVIAKLMSQKRVAQQE